MSNEEQKRLIDEIRNEQQISSYITDESIKILATDGIYDIEEVVGYKINFLEDRKARSLLKNYVFYANYKRLAEFKELYRREYVELQIKYNKDADLS